MKKNIILLLVLLPTLVFAQKEDNNWTIGNYIINFNYNPPLINHVKNPTTSYNLMCISDKNGNLLYRYGNNKLYDNNDNLIFTNIGVLMHSPSLIPFPYNDDKTLFFYNISGKNVCCAIIENNKVSSPIKTFPRKNQKFIFIQQKNTENIWFLSSVNNKIEISLITEKGFSEPKILDIPYDVSNSIISYDNSQIIFIINDKKSVLFNFNSEKGILTEKFQFNLYAQCSFSYLGNYIYNIEKNNENTCNIVRYNIKDATNEKSLLNSKIIIDQIPNWSVTIPKIAPNKNIYINCGTSLHTIYECDSENAYCKKNNYTFENPISFLPYTFHYYFEKENNSLVYTVCSSSIKTYTIDSPEENTNYYWDVKGGVLNKNISNTVTVKWQDTEGEGTLSVYGENIKTNCKSEAIVYKIIRVKSPDASFNNSQICLGDNPLEINLNGTAPFEVTYTLNGKESTINTSDKNIELKNIPGKYKLTNIKDKTCEFSPSENNEAEVYGKISKPKIIAE